MGVTSGLRKDAVASMSANPSKSAHISALPVRPKRDCPTTVITLFANRPPRMVQAAGALEAMPHLAERICLLWGHGEFEPYVNRLILDSRDGARQGLPWEAAQELLFLAELSMAKRALTASEVTGVPFDQMFARCLETAERTGQAAATAAPALSLAPKADPWADPRANSDASRRENKAQTGAAGNAPARAGWLGKLLA